jgi:hypothetical protein
MDGGGDDSGIFVEDCEVFSENLVEQSPQNRQPVAARVTYEKEKESLDLDRDTLIQPPPAASRFTSSDHNLAYLDDDRKPAASLPDKEKEKEKTNVSRVSDVSTVAMGSQNRPKKRRRRGKNTCSLHHLPQAVLSPASKSPEDVTTAYLGDDEKQLGIPYALILEAVLWKIAEFLPLKHQNKMRLVSSNFNRVLVKGAKSVVSPFKSVEARKQFVERVKTSNEWFDRLQIEFNGSKVIEDLYETKTGGKGFFQHTNSLRRLETLTLSKPGDYTVLKALGELPNLKKVCIREGKNELMRNRSSARSSRPSYKKYESQDYSQVVGCVEQIELRRCKVPPELIGDLVRAPAKLTGLKVWRCDCRNIEDDRHFFEALSDFQGKEFKFCPEITLNPFAGVTPTDEEAAREGITVIRRVEGEGEIDRHARLSNRILECVCNSNKNLSSLSLRNVAVSEGCGLEPLRKLTQLQKLCLSALTSFQDYHLQLISHVGRDTLQKLCLVNCSMIEGHISSLAGLTKLEELSLTVTSLCARDIVSLSDMRQLKVLNVFGQIQIQNDDDLSPLEDMKNLRHLSLQIRNKVPPNQGLPLGKLSSLESLCLRWRFLEDLDETDLYDTPILCVNVDEESTLNLMDRSNMDVTTANDVDEASTLNWSMAARMDQSVMDETTVNEEKQEQDDDMFFMLMSPFDLTSPHNIRSLVLYDSDLTTVLTQFISQYLNQLQDLSLWDCDALTEESITHLSTMQSLEKLCLHRFDAMTEDSLETLSNLDSVEELEFYLCKNIRDANIESNLGLMRSLTKLTISPYRLEKPASLARLELVTDDSEDDAKKRVENLLQKIYARGLF